MNNKAIITLLTVILVFGLFGCGSQQTEAPKEQPKSTQTEKTPEAQKPAETAKPTEPSKPAETTPPTTTPSAPAVEEEDCEC